MLRKVVSVATVMCLAFSFAGCSKLIETINGGVTMDANIIEQNIQDKYAETLVEVTVECPDPFVAKVGESRNCLVTDTFGTTAIAKVTVENSEGTFTWVVE